ncbi:hypothetical protein SpCBS45565_g04243 [Spizellomyces sp. 'palustris']|nr:hypothetical protein SpCBS45565_g04243 [Spizellomyces sp. 'palustris']
MLSLLVTFPFHSLHPPQKQNINKSPFIPDATPQTHLYTTTLHHLQTHSPHSLTHATALHDHTHETLHALPYHRIPSHDRTQYTHATILKACAQLLCKDLSAAFRTVDIGLVMVGSHPILHTLITNLESLIGDKDYTYLGTQFPVSSDPEPTIPHPVPIIAAPSVLTFQTYLRQNKPILIQGAIEWPALKLWQNPSYIAKQAANRTVPIEIGKDYTEREWTQGFVRIGEWLEEVVKGRGGYLAQYDLFAHVPQLRGDILVPDYCFVDDNDSDDGRDVLLHAWFGPKGTISPLHHDPYHNLFAQIVGTKFIVLYPPDANVYPHETDLLRNTSQVDVEHVDLSKFPGVEGGLECVVRPGEMLFIPKGWWHYVRALSTSLSVSFWF